MIHILTCSHVQWFGVGIHMSQCNLVGACKHPSQEQIQQLDHGPRMNIATLKKMKRSSLQPAAFKDVKDSHKSHRTHEARMEDKQTPSYV